MTPLRFQQVSLNPQQSGTLLARIKGLLRRCWQKLCPWETGDLPEIRQLEAFYAPPHRPPPGSRHRSGRRVDAAGDASEFVAAGKTSPKPAFSLTVSARTLTDRRR